MFFLYIRLNMSVTSMTNQFLCVIISKYVTLFSMKSICHLIILSTTILADIERRDDGFMVSFTVVNKGRLYNVIDVIQKKLDLGYCLYACIQHLNCKTVNYNYRLQLCELNDMDYDEYEADENPSHDWWNYGTPQQSKNVYFQYNFFVE